MHLLHGAARRPGLATGLLQSTPCVWSPRAGTPSRVRIGRDPGRAARKKENWTE